MRFLRFALGLGAAVVIHLGGAAASPSFALFFDLLALVAVLNGLAHGPLAGLFGGALAGFVHDLLSGSPYGYHGFADTFVGYLTARVGQRIIVERPSAVMLTVIAATFAQQAVLFALTVGLISGREPQSPLWWAVKALANGLLAFWIYTAAASFEKARDRRKTDRVDRLRMSR